jgi:hypothetical protein
LGDEMTFFTGVYWPKRRKKMKKIASLLIIILIGVASIAGAKTKPRKFYLTQGTFTGSQALTACADGYHMASLWEILDVTSLRYDTTLGLIAGDSGFGPPDGGPPGWIRTGSFSTGTVMIAGTANCLAWTSSNNSDVGTRVFLVNTWDFGPGSTLTDPWQASTDFCDSNNPVWCVQDFKGSDNSEKRCIALHQARILPIHGVSIDFKNPLHFLSANL